MQIFPVCCLICIEVLNFNIFKSVHFFFTGCFFCFEVMKIVILMQN